MMMMMPPPPRRSRRNKLSCHRLRVFSPTSCSECHHCPSNLSCNKSRSKLHNLDNHHHHHHHHYPSNHLNLHHHPLVRSKSAVVRSLCKRMRAPFARSRTLDDSILSQHYSPPDCCYETMPATTRRHHNSRHQQRLIEKFRAKNRHYNDIRLTSSAYGAPSWSPPPRGRSRSWQGRGPYNATRSSMRRALLASRARSFDYHHHADYEDYEDDRFPQFSSPAPPRRSRSFECAESVTGNVFSDDSLQTARQKIKKNLELSDEGYGEKIAALGDRSKSYYDSNTDAKFSRDAKKIKTRIKDLKIMQLDDDDDGYLDHQQQRQHLMYGYDSELSCGETEIYMPSEFRGGLDNVGYDDETNEHIYCSIDEMAAGRHHHRGYYPNYKAEIAELSRWRRTSPDPYSVKPRPIYDNWNNYGGGSSTLRYEYPAADDGILPVNSSYLSSSRELAQPAFYENVPYRYVGGGRRTPPFPRAESTPIFYSEHPPDDDYYRRIRQLQRRRRNTSCPESREIDRYAEDYYSRRGGGFLCYDNVDPEEVEERTRRVLQSDEDELAGSSETVIDTTVESLITSTPPPGKGHRNLRKRKPDPDCPDCQAEIQQMERARQQRRHSRRRNSSCPEPPYDEKSAYDYEGGMPREQHQQQQQTKRNVAISDTLEYYEYSMESSSQCSAENCGFADRNNALAPHSSLDHERAPHHHHHHYHHNKNNHHFNNHYHQNHPPPGNAANSLNIFDSQTDTATNNAHHHHDYRSTYHHRDDRYDYDDRYDDRYDNRYDDQNYNDGDDNVRGAGYRRQPLRQRQRSPTSGADDLDDEPQPHHRLSRRRRSSRLHDHLQHHHSSSSSHHHHDDYDERDNNRRSSSMPERSEYGSQGSSYERPSSRYRHSDDPELDRDAPLHRTSSRRTNGSVKRGQFTRSFSNSDPPTDDKVGKCHDLSSVIKLLKFNLQLCLLNYVIMLNQVLPMVGKAEIHCSDLIENSVIHLKSVLGHKNSKKVASFFKTR